jgi:hypothetical protein
MRILSALLMLLVSGTVLVAAFYSTPFFGCYGCSEVKGANVDNGMNLASYAGVTGFVLVLLVKKRRRLLACVELLVVAAVSVALVLISLDSATIVYANPGGQTIVSTYHVDYVYALWGIAIVVLLSIAIVRWTTEATQT